MSASAETLTRTHSRLREKLGVVYGWLTEIEGLEDIHCNADGRLWVRGDTGAGARITDRINVEQRRSIINAVASLNESVVDEDKPFVEAVLPWGGARFTGLIPPMSEAPVFSIRVKVERVPSLSQYVDAQIMTTYQAGVIEKAIEDKKNILIAGGTGSGKTTLLNSMLHHLALRCPGQRVLTIEDTFEINCTSADHIALHADANRNITMQDCLRSALRMCPERIIVGEVRGSEALTLIKAWNTGHPGGMATIHANDAESSLIRLQELAEESGLKINPWRIVEGIDLVAFMTEDKEVPAGRALDELRWVSGYGPGGYELEDA